MFDLQTQANYDTTSYHELCVNSLQLQHTKIYLPRVIPWCYDLHNLAGKIKFKVFINPDYCILLSNKVAFNSIRTSTQVHTLINTAANKMF